MKSASCLLVCVSLLCVGLIAQGQILFTTPYIEQVFKGKCLYKTSITTSSVVLQFNSSEAYCDELWVRFDHAASLPSYDQTNVTWGPFFDIADFSSPPDGAMLWSGSYAFSQDLINQYTTLEATVTGYIINGLWWCPSDIQNSPFNMSAPCAFNDDVPSGYYGLAPVWREASKRFAAGITGQVSVLLQSRINYSDPNAAPVTFRSDSIFATIELPTLNPQAVTSLVALYMPGDRDYFEIENCNNGTLLTLKSAVTARFAGYPTTYFCFDDNKLIMKLCTNKSSEEIQNIENGIDSLNELLEYVNNFDFPTAQSLPECAVGVLAYLAGVQDVYTFVTPIINSEDQLLTVLNATNQRLNDTLAQLSDVQKQLDQALQQLSNLSDTDTLRPTFCVVLVFLLFIVTVI